MPGLVCLSVLCGILVAGLMPFQCPRNAVTWLGNESGLRFGGHGTIWSSGTFQMTGSQDEASCSLEVYLQPRFSSDAKTLLAFSTPENPLQFSLHQHLSGLLAKRDPFFFPVKFGRNEQVDIDPLVIMKIDRLTVFRMILGSRSHTAPEGMIVGAVQFEYTRFGGHEIAEHARLRVL